MIRSVRVEWLCQLKDLIDQVDPLDRGFFALGFRLSEHPPDRTGLDEARGHARGQRERASFYAAYAA